LRTLSGPQFSLFTSIIYLPNLYAILCIDWLFYKCFYSIPCLKAFKRIHSCVAKEFSNQLIVFFCIIAAFSRTGFVFLNACNVYCQAYRILKMGWKCAEKADSGITV
jgi:hypothetical protein